MEGGHQGAMIDLLTLATVPLTEQPYAAIGGQDPDS